MTLEEAKVFYFRYRGFSFHMDREEPRQYNSFLRLQLGNEVLGKWDGELLDDAFKQIRSQPERAGAIHQNILDIIRRGKCDAGKYLGLLLDEMENMDRLDLLNTTLIVENMAGRTESMRDGGVRVFRRHPALLARMNGIMEDLIRSGSARFGGNERLKQAAGRYKLAYDNWGTSKRRS